jgi:hypothetical protein
MPVPSTSSPRPARSRRRSFFWLRLLLLAATGIGFSLPLIVAAVFRLTRQEAVEVTRQFLVDLRDGRTDVCFSLLTPKARHGEDISVPGKQYTPKRQTIENRLQLFISPHLRGFDFFLESPVRRGEFLDVPFVMRHDETRSLAPVNRARKNNLQPGPGSAEVFKQLNEQYGTVHLRQIDGHWRVSGLTLPVIFAEGMTPSESESRRPLRSREYDFEQLDLFLPSPAKSPFDLLEPIAVAEFAAAWQIDVDVANRPARDVLEPLVREIGRSIVPQSLSPFVPGTISKKVRDALARPVSLHLRKVSRFQAIEEICRQVGIYPKYNSATFLTFFSGRRPHPVALRGPFLLEVDKVTQDGSYPVGTLTLSLHTTPFPEKIHALFSTFPVYVSGLKIVGPAGEDLYHANKTLSAWPELGNFWGARAPGAFFTMLRGSPMLSTWKVPLKNLLRDLDTIAEVRCSVQMMLPRGVQSLNLEPVAPGRAANAGDFRITFLKVDPTPPKIPGQSKNLAKQKRFDFRAQPLDRRRLCYRSFYSSETPGDGWVYPPSSGDFSIFLPNEPDRFSFKALTPGETLVWNFQLRNIALARIPRRIEPLRFEGYSAPVDVEMVGLTALGVEMRVINHSRKDIDSLDLKLAYKDKDGRIVGAAVRKVAADPSDNADLIISKFALLGDPTENQLVVDRTERPKGTHKVEMSVTRILFKDATIWHP